MKVTTMQALKRAPGSELDAMSARCGMPALAAKLTALAAYPRGFSLLTTETPGWLAGFAAGLTDEEGAKLDELMAQPPEDGAGPGPAEAAGPA